MADLSSNPVHVGLQNLTVENALEQGGMGQGPTSPGLGGAGGGAGLGGGLFVGARATVGLYGVGFSGNAAIGGAGGAGGYTYRGGYYGVASGGPGNATGGAPGYVGNGGSNGTQNAQAVNGFDGFGHAGYTRFGLYNPNTHNAPIGAYGGGGGLGAGGNVFVAAGGHLTIGGTSSETGGYVKGGAGGASPFAGTPNGLGKEPGTAEAGGALGSGLFSNGNVDITLSPAAGETQIYQDNIAGGIGFDITGAGTVEFDGKLTYGGQTTIESGSLVITGDMSGISGAIVDKRHARARAIGRYDGERAGVGQRHSARCRRRHVDARGRRVAVGRHHGPVGRSAYRRQRAVRSDRPRWHARPRDHRHGDRQ